jgi:type VI secretion system protein ImpM
MSRLVQTPLLYFGKVPARGDFIRSNHAPALIQTIDRWINGGIEAMADDARWQWVYDRAPPLRFAQLGARSAVGMAGYLIASRDAAGRRYPLLTAAQLDIANPLAFFARSPLVLSRAWQRLENAARKIHEAPDATHVLSELGQTTVEVEDDVQAYDPPMRDFLELQSVQALETMLRREGHTDFELRRSILSLGLLLQPVLAGGHSRLDKGLLLPLPADSLYSPLVGSLWLDLISGFLARSDFELAVFMPASTGQQAPVLRLGFEGSSPRTLQAMLDPAVGTEYFIDIRQADWVDAHVGNHHGIMKLSSYLTQGHLSLAQVCHTFKEVFLGA